MQYVQVGGLWYCTSTRNPCGIADSHFRVLDTLNSALIAHGVYYYLVLNYANPVAVLLTIWYVIVRLLPCTRCIHPIL